MSQEVFPITPNEAYYPVDDTISFNTIISPFSSGTEQREKKWTKGKRTVTILCDYEIASADLIDEVYDFYKARFGAWDSFWIKNPNAYDEIDEAVGTGDDAETVFYLDNYPADSSNIAIYFDGVLTTAYTFLNDTVNKLAKITFNAAPGNGVVITATYEYYIVVRFSEDTLSRKQYARRLFSTGINVVEEF